MKKLTDILSSRSPHHILENSDEYLEALLEEPQDLEEGDVALVMARLSDIIDMSDDLYNTVSELSTVDEKTQESCVQIYNCLDTLYKGVKDKYNITTPEYDFDADGVDDLEEGISIQKMLDAEEREAGKFLSMSDMTTAFDENPEGSTSQLGDGVMELDGFNAAGWQHLDGKYAVRVGGGYQIYSDLEAAKAYAKDDFEEGYKKGKSITLPEGKEVSSLVWGVFAQTLLSKIEPKDEEKARELLKIWGSWKDKFTDKDIADLIDKLKTWGKPKDGYFLFAIDEIGKIAAAYDEPKADWYKKKHGLKEARKPKEGDMVIWNKKGPAKQFSVELLDKDGKTAWLADDDGEEYEAKVKDLTVAESTELTEAEKKTHTIKLHFYDNASKQGFMKRNNIHPNEIVPGPESKTSLEIFWSSNDPDWQKSPFVYQTDEPKKWRIPHFREDVELTEGMLTVQKLRKIFMNADDWGEDIKNQIYIEGGRLVFIDSYYYGGDKALASLVKSWKPGGSYYDYFKKTYGAHIQVVDSFQEIRAIGRHKKLTTNGIVGVKLKVESGSDTSQAELEEGVKVNEDRTGRSYWIAEEDYVADLGQIKKDEIYLSTGQTEEEMVPTDNGLEAFDVINISIAAPGTSYAEALDPHVFKKIFKPLDPSKHKFAVNKLKRWDLVVPSATGEIVEAKIVWTPDQIKSMQKASAAEKNDLKKKFSKGKITIKWSQSRAGHAIFVKGRMEGPLFDTEEDAKEYLRDLGIDFASRQVESTELTEASATPAPTKTKVGNTNWLSSAEYDLVREKPWFKEDEWEWDSEMTLYGRKTIKETKVLSIPQAKQLTFLDSKQYNQIKKKYGFKAEDWSWNAERKLYEKAVDTYTTLYARLSERFLGEKVGVDFKNKETGDIVAPRNQKLNAKKLKEIAELLVANNCKLAFNRENQDEANSIAEIIKGEDSLQEQKPNDLQTVIEKLSDRLLGKPMRVTLHNSEASGSYKSSKWNTKIIKDAAELLLQGRLKITYSKGNETHAQKIKEFFVAVKAGISPSPAKKLESFLKK